MAKLNIRNRNEGHPTRPANWEYRFEAARIEGKRKSVSKSGFKTKKEAFKPMLGGGNLRKTNIKTHSQLFNRKDRSLKMRGIHF